MGRGGVNLCSPSAHDRRPLKREKPRNSIGGI
nr:MAG TPA: hypothetical protein [Caudoviricetes sp.]